MTSRTSTIELQESALSPEGGVLLTSDVALEVLKYFCSTWILGCRTIADIEQRGSLYKATLPYVANYERLNTEHKLLLVKALLYFFSSERAKEVKEMSQAIDTVCSYLIMTLGYPNLQALEEGLALQSKLSEVAGEHPESDKHVNLLQSLVLLMKIQKQTG